MKNFPCNQCGACCRQVNLSPLTSYLDRGDGACKNYNEYKKDCMIYEKRPEICRVDIQYIKNYQSSYSWEDFVRVNLIACKQLEDSVEGK